MEDHRILKHPILPIEEREDVLFTWNGEPLLAKKGEMISSALIANGINIFGHHHKDGSAQGIFCANGQCAKCTVIADGLAVKSCMTAVTPGMEIRSLEGLPELPDTAFIPKYPPLEKLEVDVLIIGGGPAGLSAAIELGKYNINTLLIDDKQALGGKLVLQTHKFFGSEEDSNAGMRGIEIGKLLALELQKYPSVQFWLNSTALFVFSDQKVGILKDGIYKLVTPHIILNAAGAREKFLRFPGNDLARIYGAGAFQTLVNRDLVRPTNRLFIIGGGNVGLIAGYHALQAGINVVGLAEAMPQCGGYKVHSDKLKRLGVPIYTSHTIINAAGKETVESITIAQIDSEFKPIPGTEKSFACDTLLIAVGLNSLSEFTQEAKEAGIQVFSAGDAQEIAEASSAMFNGKIAGLTIAKEYGKEEVEGIPSEWYAKAEVLKSHPGKIKDYQKDLPEQGVFPIIHCLQEIPCNPCTTVCPTNSIHTEDDGLMSLPVYSGNCIGCYKCVLICPGLAITLVDYRNDKEHPIVTIPYEVFNIPKTEGEEIELVDIDGNPLGFYPIIAVLDVKKSHTQLIKVQVPQTIAKRVASFRIQAKEISEPLSSPLISEKLPDEAMVCLCERVKVGDIRKLIKSGITNLNQIKAITRSGMGPCGAKTCENLILQLLREEGIPTENIVSNTLRPLFIEVPLEKFPDGD
ncbi:MAG: FAD-dependent oxidoreductase [Candidatus Cloacimonadaceae bacterium]|jgi:sarcosine oxidase subunit alpha|nr:FAD-dependent oxidoreductase [Candidatus Cloacimonadota bacterium]MCB5258557.1 FAD-dependent oxidoreductase [Candidatus Cloacimonadota bacterium]MDD5625115.1 FAD-dependent oxidoreductase [Candidatus Cloacimonadota bacterium]MDY0112002.1 FAD-dependent oxidoreductase [Candidatus Syntrophosphaera sp.]